MKKRGGRAEHSARARKKISRSERRRFLLSFSRESRKATASKILTAQRSPPPWRSHNWNTRVYREIYLATTVLGGNSSMKTPSGSSSLTAACRTGETRRDILRLKNICVSPANPALFRKYFQNITFTPQSFRGGLRKFPRQNNTQFHLGPKPQCLTLIFFLQNPGFLW